MARPRGSGVTPPVQRFWSKVDGGDVGACWLWQGAKNARGYGRFFVEVGVYAQAHRFAYESLRGDIPDGLELDHLCRTPACVNPWHLEPVTGLVNVRRAFDLTHCKHGHPYTDENTIRRANGRRRCRTCHNERRRAAWATDPSTAPVGEVTPDAFLGV